MAHATTNTSRLIRGDNSMLLLPPMLITLAFCYSFVLMQPQAKPSSTLAASGTKQGSVAADNDSVSALSLAPQTSRTRLSDNVLVSNSAAPTSSGPLAQPSATNALSLQAATASNGNTVVINVNRSGASKASSKTSRTAHRTPTFLNSLRIKQ